MSSVLDFLCSHMTPEAIVTDQLQQVNLQHHRKPYDMCM